MHSVMLCLLVVLSQVLVSESSFLKMGPVGEYEIITFEQCSIKTELNSSIHLDIIKKGNIKSISGKLILNVNFDKSYTGDLRVDTWTGSEWKKDSYKQSGKLCELIALVSPKIYKRLLLSMKPSIDSKCDIPKNIYTFDNIRAVPSEINIPALKYGKKKGTFVVSDKSGKKLLCFIIEIAIKE